MPFDPPEEPSRGDVLPSLDRPRLDPARPGTLLPLRSLLEPFLDALSDVYRSGVTIAPRAPRARAFTATLSGLRRGDLLVLESGPGAGKTSLALNTARHVALRDKLAVMLFTPRMDAATVTLLLIAAESGIHPERLCQGRLSDSDWPKLSYSIDRLALAPIFIDGGHETLVTDIRAHADWLHNGGSRPGLVVVDDVQDLRPDPHARLATRTAAATEMSWAMKSLAAAHDTTVLAISRLSRQAGMRLRRRPLAMTELTGTTAFGAGADIVMVLAGDELLRRGRRPGVFELATAGEPRGPDRTISLRHDNPDFAFSDAARRSTQLSLPL